MSKWTVDKIIDIFQAIVATIAFALIVYVMSSCKHPTREDGVLYLQWEVVVIDSCEYVVPKANMYSITHKANCKNKKGHNQ